ncbi:MAG: RdgB/HAM1 family non-canonical purine NTP pyrophosphatase [Gammaproteobacteria bacterium]|nr:RdgB/HAM1 family non-canonical purine NTP pyrophosphatase [Gammaproteobacteria bacterium]
MKKIVVASGNQGKIREIRAKLDEFGAELVSQTDLNVSEAVEDGLSFVENALIKARNASRQTKLPAIADDSGIVVPALGGQPGIFSARYAGVGASDQANLQKLLNELAKLPNVDRAAYFYCAIVYVQFPDDPTPLVSTGQWDGVIAATSSGNEGFGYDPVFYLPEKNCTAANLALTEKIATSHRGKALAAFVEQYRATKSRAYD